MSSLIKVLLLFILSLALSFGMWYLAGWFVSGESDIMIWPWWGKVIYLILSLGGLSSIANELEEL